MSISARYRKKSVLLALGFTLLFLISSTVNYNIEPFPYDSETRFPIIKNLTPSALGTEDYVDSNLSDIDSSPDTGTHSLFASQQAGPDSIFDTLQEENTDPPPSNTEDDIDSNTSNIDSVTDIGTEQNFANSQGTQLDSSNMVLTEANAGQVPVQDFVVITGTTTFGSGQATVTITEGVDYTLESGQDSSTCFIRITNTKYTAMGEISGGGSQNHDTWAAKIQNPDNIATSITFERDATTTTEVRVTWEILQYVGSSGGANEIIVRDVGSATCSGTTSTCDGTSISTISDSSDVVVFITGQFAVSASRNDIQYGLFTASLEGSDPYTPRFTRSMSVSSNDGVSYAVVEFTGSNWRSVQRLEITTEASTAWTTSNYATAYTDVTIASEGGVDLLNYSKAFTHMQYRTDNNPTGIDDAWDNVEIIDNSNLRIRNSATSGNRWKVVWIIENTQSGQGQMQVEHLYWYDGTTSGSEERVFTQSITAVDQMNQTSLFLYVSMDATVRAFPRGVIDYRLTAVDTITLTESDMGDERLFTGTVVQWPYSFQDTPYKVNFEYQWTSTDFDEVNEEVCIYVSSHTGSENLTVSYWNSGWQTLGTISSTGWFNFTATGLSGSTYTLRFLGSSEAVDASQDVWNIDLITLHTWTLLSYNYELDLEIQWTSAQYSDTSEELCIYSGTLDAESIRVDVWAGSSWTNVLFDLSANAWTNVSVASWLTGPTFTVRFRGDVETGDTVQSSWQIDSALLHTWNNSVPLNAAQPSISNIDDISYLYAQYKQYQITAFASDGDGFADIDYLEITLASDDRLTEYWTVRYDEDTNVFNEQSDPSNYIVLDVGSSSAIESGTIINATFYVSINWNHPDISNADVKCEVFDSIPASSQDYYEVDWDVETRLDTSVGPILDDGSGTANRGDVDGSMTASGTVTYLGSSIHPSSSDIDVWISAAEYGTQTGPWEATNYEDVGGTFSATVYADDVVGLDAFTFKAVEEGSGAGGSDLFGSGQSTNYISDRVQVQSFSTDDSRINVDGTASMHVTLYYDYDDSFVADGIVTINGISATYSSSNGVWDFSDSESAVQMNTYDTLVYTGGTHGITVEDQNGQNLNQIWDQITVVSYSVIDDRVDVNSSVDIDVTLVYAYDSAAVTDGTVTINGKSAIHQGVGVWRLSDTKATVQDLTYNLVAASGNTHGITDVDQNSQSQLVIWDQVTVISYSVFDDRVNLDDTVDVNITLEYAYDNTAVIDGVVTINLVLAAHQGNGVWQISTSKSTVQGITYNSVVCSGNSHGISDVNQNFQSQLVIWDQITVRSYSVSDGRVNINDDVDINVTIEYEYDDTPVTLGTVTINAIVATHLGGGVWNITDSKPTIQLVTYDTVVCSGNSHGITDVNQNSQSSQVIWDRITVRSYTVTDSRVNVDAAENIDVLIQYEYDDTGVTDGSVTINALSATHIGAGVWRITDSKSNVQSFTYNTVVCSGNTFGITDVNQNGQTQTIIWDRIQVITTVANDTRIDIGTFCEIRVTLWLEYDSTLLGLGDSVTLDGVAMTWDAGDSRFELSRQQLSVGQWLYYINSTLESTYGISVLNLNSQNASVIWDQIRILTTVVDDARVGIGSNVELRVTAELSFDGHLLQIGDTIILDSSSMTWDVGNSWFDLTRSQASVGLWAYQVDSAFEATYGISAVDLNGQSQQVIWDQLTVNIVADMDSVANTVQVNFTVTVTFQYDSVECTTYTIRIARNATHWYTFTSANISLFVDSNSDTAYAYNTSIVTSETTYGITEFSTNTETVSWGVLTAAPVNDTAPILTNPDDTDFMYAKLRYYIITSNVSDAQGYSDINYVELSLWDNTRATEIWRIRYTESTNAFSTEVGPEYLTLVGSSFVKIGNDIDITWVLKIDWDHLDLLNVDVRQYVIDDSAESDINWYESDWNVETRLDFSASPSLSDDRGDLNTNDLMLTGTVVYYGSALNPLANETDVWVSHDMSGTWSGNVNGVGFFSIGSINSSASVRLNTYTVKVVVEGNGSGGTDLYYTSSLTTDFITDRIEFYLSGVLDGRINVNDTGTVWWNARYDYDNTEITSGLTSLLNGSKTLIWDSINSRWYYSESIPSVSRVGYSVLSATESGYGLTGWTQTASDISIIWDLIVVRSYSVLDSRVELTVSVDIDVLLEFEFDDSIVNDGTVVINSVTAVYQGSGIWRISESRSTVLSLTYDTVGCSGNSLGISIVNQNSQQQIVIWDEIAVRSYSVVDNRVNVDDSVNITVTLEYEYDDTAVTDGSVTINGDVATHVAGGVWRVTDSKSSVQSVTYDTVAVSSNFYDISNVNQNAQSQTVIWDQITVRSYLVLDSRVNVNDSVAVDVTIEYEYDDTNVADGSVHINGVSATYRGSGVWRISVSESFVGANIYNSVVASGNAIGITSVNQNGQSQQVIWDQVVVRSLTSSDDRDDVGNTITVFVTLEYEYDDADVTDGLVIVNTVLFTYTGANGVWSTNRTQNVVMSETYDSVVVSGNTFGIGSVDQSGSSSTIIWDRIRILTTSVDDARMSISSTARIMVTAELEYDGHQLISGDSLFLDDSLMTWDAGNSWFYLDTSQVTVGIWNYFVNTSGAAETTYGISLVNTMGLSQNVIWDRLLITITPDSSSVTDFTDVNFTLAITFDYDDTICTTYVVDVSRNGTYWKSFSSINASLFIDSNAAQTYQYSIQNVAVESAFSITVFTTNAVDVTWTTPANFAPFNNGAPILLNPDDTESMFSRMRYYFIRSSIVDYDGTSDIDYVELSLWDNSRIIEIWRIRFTLGTQTFSIVVGSEYINLAGSSYFELGSQLNVTWSIKVDWDHFDLSNTDVRQYAVDLVAVSDTDWFETDWDIETRLDYTTLPALSDDRGDVGTSDLQATGSIVYFGSFVSPLANETDIWVIHDFSGTWSSDVDISGDFTTTNIGSSASVRLNSYTFKIVIAGAGPGASDLYYTTSPIDTYITDRIEFYQSGVVDSRIDINSDGIVWWNARYEYDGVEIQSGLSAILNGSKLLSWDVGNNRWYYQESRVSSQKVGYSISGATDSNFTLTLWTQIAVDQFIIWDSLVISITSPTDQRINLNENATGISVSAIYSFDSTTFDGTIALNNTVFQYATVTRQYYTASSAIGGIHGISAISSNEMVWCIWDRVEVVSIFTNATYLDPSEYVILQMFLRYDFDDSPIISGNFSLSFADFYHVADGLWEANATRLAFATVNYDTLTTSFASAFGITGFNMYGNVRTVYWDRLEFYESSAVDSRINVGSTGFSLWSVRLENAGIDITSSVIAQATGSVALTYVDGNWQASHTSAVVGDQTFTILSASLEGIDFFISSTNDVTIIWDRIQVLTTSASSSNPAIEQFIIITATLSYEYDGTAVTDGVVTLWDQDSQITMSYNASGGFWYANITKVDIGEYTFYVEAVSGNQFGITVVSVGGHQITIEFVPPPLPRLTPMMIAGISGGVAILIIISAVAIRRRYYVEVPYEIKQINAILEAIEKEEKVEEIDVKPVEQSVLDLLEPGLFELGLTMDEILTAVDEAELEEIRVLEPDMEMVEALEEFELPEPEPEEEEEEEVTVREIPEPESTGEFEELDVEAYTDMESAAEEALALMLEEVRKIKDKGGVKVPLTKDDWIEKIPSEVKSQFFEEELKELELPDIEQLAKMSAAEVEELLDSVTDLKETDMIDTESSYVEIVDALKIKFNEIDEEELDEDAQKKRIIQSFPSFVLEHFSEGWLETLSFDEVKELTQLSEDELKMVIDSLTAAKGKTRSEEIEKVEEIDLEEELERLDLVEDSNEPAVEEVEDHDVDVKIDDRNDEEEAGKLDNEEDAEESTIKESEVEEIDLEEIRKLEEELEDLDAKPEDVELPDIDEELEKDPHE
jgi:hypothetical protein